MATGIPRTPGTPSFRAGFKKPIAEPIPAPKETDLESIRYAANRCDDSV